MHARKDFDEADLPALSPTSATTSPAETSSAMSVNAFTAPKDLLTPRKLSRLVVEGAAAAPEATAVT
jgi:hypothetical protein